jgi:hypothetical protein
VKVFHPDGWVDVYRGGVFVYRYFTLEAQFRAYGWFDGLEGGGMWPW